MGLTAETTVAGHGGDDRADFAKARDMLARRASAWRVVEDTGLPWPSVVALHNAIVAERLAAAPGETLLWERSP